MATKAFAIASVKNNSKCRYFFIRSEIYVYMVKKMGA